MSTHREWLRSGAQMMLLSLIEEQDRYGFEIIQELEKIRQYICDEGREFISHTP